MNKNPSRKLDTMEELYMKNFLTNGLKENFKAAIKNTVYQKWAMTGALVLALGATVSLNPETKYIARNDATKLNQKFNPTLNAQQAGSIELASEGNEAVKSSTFDLEKYYPEYKDYQVKFTYNSNGDTHTYKFAKKGKKLSDGSTEATAESCLDCRETRLINITQNNLQGALEIAQALVAKQVVEDLKKQSAPAKAQEQAASAEPEKKLSKEISPENEDYLAKFMCNKAKNSDQLDCAKTQIDNLISQCESDQDKADRTRKRGDRIDRNRCVNLVTQYYNAEIRTPLREELKRVNFNAEDGFSSGSWGPFSGRMSRPCSEENTFGVLGSSCLNAEYSEAAVELRNHLLNLDPQYSSKLKRDLMQMSTMAVKEQTKELVPWLRRDMDVRDPALARLVATEYVRWNAMGNGMTRSDMNPFSTFDGSPSAMEYRKIMLGMAQGMLSPQNGGRGFNDLYDPENLNTVGRSSGRRNGFSLSDRNRNSDPRSRNGFSRYNQNDQNNQFSRGGMRGGNGGYPQIGRGNGFNSGYNNGFNNGFNNQFVNNGMYSPNYVNGNMNRGFAPMNQSGFQPVGRVGSGSAR
jgi:hypothetical protein